MSKSIVDVNPYVGMDIESSNLDADFGMVLTAVIKPFGAAPIVLRHDKQKSYGPPGFLDKELVRDIRDVLQEIADDAGILVTYNGKRFDLRFLNTRLIANRLKPIRYGMHVDLFQEVRRHLRMGRYSLEAVQRLLELDTSKTKILPQYWIPALRGDKKAMDYVVDHCIKDVMVVEEVFPILRPFISRLDKSGF